MIANCLRSIQRHMALQHELFKYVNNQYEQIEFRTEPVYNMLRLFRWA